MRHKDCVKIFATGCIYEAESANRIDKNLEIAYNLTQYESEWEDECRTWTPVTVALTLTETIPFCSNIDVRHDLYRMISVWAVSFAIF